MCVTDLHLVCVGEVEERKIWYKSERVEFSPVRALAWLSLYIANMSSQQLHLTQSSRPLLPSFLFPLFSLSASLTFLFPSLFSPPLNTCLTLLLTVETLYKCNPLLSSNYKLCLSLVFLRTFPLELQLASLKTCFHSIY